MSSTPTFRRDQLPELLAFFKANNYAVISDGMNPKDVTFLHDFVDHAQGEHPDEWGISGSRKMFSHGQILMNYPELDPYVRYTGYFPAVRAILGDEVRFAQYDFRDAPQGSGREVGMAFHQDRPQITQKNWDETHPYECAYLCSIVYLTDVNEDSPCFCVVPNSHRYPSLDEAKRTMTDYVEIPIRGKAGTVVLYNIAIFHTRLAGTSDDGRRTQHTYFSRESSPVLTNWVLLPERLALHPDPETRAFYSQWTPAGIEYAKQHFTASESASADV